MKNFPAVLPALARGQKKAVTVAAKSGQFTADKKGKGQFLRGNRRNLAGEEVGKIPNIPEGFWMEKRWGRGENGKGPTESPVRKWPIESDMILDASDTIPGHVPVQRTQLRS